MSKTSAISPSQLFAIMILFELGTAIVLPIGHTVGSNAWLSILLAMPGGILLYILLVYFDKQYPTLILSGYIQKITGVYIGWFVSFLYVVYFIHLSARNLREAGDLLISASYDQTPSAVVHAAMITAVIYIIYKGINVLFRLGEIYIIIMLVFGTLSVMAILVSGTIEIRNLLPILGEGWGSTFRNAYPNIFLFPFAELICFSTILPHLKQKKTAIKTGVLAIIVSTLLLSLTHALEVAVISGDVYSRATFPLFTMISIIEVAEFMQRLDAFVILALIIGVFFKMTIYAYAASAITAHIFRFPEQRTVAYPIGVIIFLISALSAWSFPEHNNEGIAQMATSYPLFSTYIPVSLLLIHLIKTFIISHLSGNK